MRKRIISFSLVGLLLSVFGFFLTSCAALELGDEYIDVPGTNGAWVETQHGGAPWNSSTAVWVFVDDPTASKIVTAIKSLAEVLASSGRDLGSSVSVRVVDGSPEQFSNGSFRTSRDFSDWNIVVDELGVGYDGPSSVGFSASEFQSLR